MNENPVRRETSFVALGTGILCVLMIGVFLILHRFDVSVLFGALLGGGFAILNFYLLAVGVQRAAGKAAEDKAAETAAEADAPNEQSESEEEAPDHKQPVNKRVKNTLQLSYTLRLLLTAAVAIVGVKLDCFNTVAVILPLFFPRIVLMIRGLALKKKGGA